MSTSTRLIHTGPVAALIADGDLRYLRVGGSELIRRIYGAVRDEDWRTVPAVVSQSDLREHASGWTWRFRAVHRQDAIDFAWDGRVDARVASIGGLVEVSVRYEMDGRAASSFLTSRTGLCLLHPIVGCAGRPCRIEHTSGEVESSAFPDLIAPHQPFLDVRAISHEPVEGLHVEARFEGEVFETEDQRNWADGSFKTYSRPLSRPHPYRLEAGAEVRQAVTIRIKGRPPVDHGNRSGTVVAVRVGPPAGRFPPIGIAFESRADLVTNPPSREEPGPSFLRIEERGSADLPSLPAGFAEKAALPLEVGWHIPAGVPVGSIDPTVASRVGRWLVLEEGAPVARPDVVDAARYAINTAAGNVRIGLGSEPHFTELNRNRPPAGTFDFLAYPVSPQCHSTDELSIVENLEALGEQVRTARAFASGKPIGVGPIRFRNPTSTVPDPRQTSAFGAAWLLGVLAELFRAGVDWMSIDSGFHRASDLDSATSRLLRFIWPLVHGDILQVEVADPLRIAALAVRHYSSSRLLLANLTASQQTVRLEQVSPGPTQLRRIQAARSIEPIAAEPGGSIVLGPHEIVVLDGPGGG